MKIPPELDTRLRAMKLMTGQGLSNLVIQALETHLEVMARERRRHLTGADGLAPDGADEMDDDATPRNLGVASPEESVVPTAFLELTKAAAETPRKKVST